MWILGFLVCHSLWLVSLPRNLPPLIYPTVLMECNAHASLSFSIGSFPPLASIFPVGTLENLRLARAAGSKLEHDQRACGLRAEEIRVDAVSLLAQRSTALPCWLAVYFSGSRTNLSRITNPDDFLSGQRVRRTKKSS